MRGVLYCLAAILLLSSGVAAGPWPREPGRAFTAFSVEQDRQDNRYSGLYAEYGLGLRHTLGLEVGHTQGESSLLLRWQRVIGSDAGPNRWAMSLGLGAIRREGRYHPMGEFGMGWGRGFDSIPLLRRIPGGCWVAVESRSRIAAITHEHRKEPYVIWVDPTYLIPEATHKLDLTLGWHAREKTMLINQFRLEDRDDTERMPAAWCAEPGEGSPKTLPWPRGSGTHPGRGAPATGTSASMTQDVRAHQQACVIILLFCFVF